MASTLGPFHSLIDADKHRLTELITAGSSVHAAVRLLNANYRHCLNYAHHNTLITPRRQSTVVPQQRAAYDFDHGVSHTGSPRRRFIPNGPHAKAYNTCMTTLAARHDVIEEGRLSAPALPTRIDPYKTH
ncbi:hypothetical protein [Corynebacterium diphtheriae]|uniref:hypothetical protein n=1 Tax=Corynebacterium diphtheriae TaxID=1717 RepID=UPI0006831DAD|nr:hypothetical protein [Corynebacterium diphtheriae]CAB0531878.1 hypothetical protein CIP107508_00058 [Corynebacterium diphtheriae]CAB0887780.1 hypothetical protein FRC0420_00180 [Corynebacterium diphtheriae]